MLHRFDEITADLTERFGGTVVKGTGDGHLATFDGPTQAIRYLDNETRHNTHRLLADAFGGDFTVPSPVGAD